MWLRGVNLQHLLQALMSHLTLCVAYEERKFCMLQKYVSIWIGFTRGNHAALEPQRHRLQHSVQSLSHQMCMTSGANVFTQEQTVAYRPASRFTTLFLTVIFGFTEKSSTRVKSLWAEWKPTIDAFILWFYHKCGEDSSCSAKLLPLKLLASTCQSHVLQITYPEKTKGLNQNLEHAIFHSFMDFRTYGRITSMLMVSWSKVSPSQMILCAMVLSSLFPSPSS